MGPTPGNDSVEEDRVRRHYAERVVLTTAVCNELRDERTSGGHHRSAAALRLLRQWLHDANDVPLGQFGDVFTHGLSDPNLVTYCADFRHELGLGSQVCEAFDMLMTADTGSQYDTDERSLEAALDRFLTRPR